MNALLLVAHGSRRKASNTEVLRLADKLRHRCHEQYSIVHAAYLELAEPSIPQGLKLCVDEGASSIIVLPYFLNSGRHVVEDIPTIVNDTVAHYPDVDIHIAPHLGASELIMELLISSANSVKPLSC